MLLVLIFGLAFGVEKTVSAIRHVFDPNDKLPTVVWNFASMAVGVATAVGWHKTVVPAVFSAVPALQHSTALSGTSGEILSGLILGGLAGFGYGVLQRWEAGTHAKNAEVATGSQN
jgi:hypothetical protein